LFEAMALNIDSFMDKTLSSIRYLWRRHETTIWSLCSTR